MPGLASGSYANLLPESGHVRFPPTFGHSLGEASSIHWNGGSRRDRSNERLKV